MAKTELEAVDRANEKNIRKMNRQVLLLCQVIAQINARSEGWVACPVPGLRGPQCHRDCASCWFRATLKDAEDADGTSEESPALG